MRVLENAMKLPYSAKMIGDFKYAGIKIKADIGAGSSRYVMAFRNDKQDDYYPVSVMEEDIREATSPTNPVIAILRKNSDDLLYDEITYKSKNINFDKLHIPKELKNIISENILNQLVPQKNLEEIGKLTKETFIKDIVAHEGKNQGKKIRKKK